MKNHSKGFTLVEIMIVLAIIGLIVSIAVPAFLKNRHDARGMAANNELEYIFSAKRQLAFKLNAKPGDVIEVTNDQLEVYMQGVTIADGSPDGGTYIVGRLVDARGEIIIPICSSEQNAAYNGVTNGQAGLFIHRGSFIQDPKTGLYSRDPLLTFADSATTSP